MPCRISGSRSSAIVPNHNTPFAPESVVKSDEVEQVKGRAVVVKKLKPLPVEAVVRGYIIGSGWKDYQQTGSVCGIPLPKGLQQADKLPDVIFTPATKAAIGDHDENTFRHAGLRSARAREEGSRHDGPALQRGSRLREIARHHHRRHEVRVRPGRQGTAGTHRRSADG